MLDWVNVIPTTSASQKKWGNGRSPSAIKYIPLGMKLSFLRENGISTLSSIIDTKTRNQIAHMKFQVKGNQVLIKGKPVEKSLLISSTELLHASNVINDLLYQNAIKRMGGRE